MQYSTLNSIRFPTITKMIESAVFASALSETSKIATEVARTIGSEITHALVENRAVDEIIMKMSQPEMAPSEVRDLGNGIRAESEAVAEMNLKEKMMEGSSENMGLERTQEMCWSGENGSELNRSCSWADCYTGNIEGGGFEFSLESGVHKELLNQFPPPANSVERVQTLSGNTMTCVHDEWSRPVRIDIDKISHVDASRDVYQQSRCNDLKNGLPTDDAGHLLAREFGGPSEQINYLPMDAHTNRHGEWRLMEREWENALDAGKEVANIRIEPQYDSLSRRPDGFEVSYEVNGEVEYRYIDNNPTC